MKISSRAYMLLANLKANGTQVQEVKNPAVIELIKAGLVVTVQPNDVDNRNGMSVITHHVKVA